MNTNFRKFKMVALLTMAGDSKMTSMMQRHFFLEQFDDVLNVYGFVDGNQHCVEH